MLDIKWNPFIENIIASCSEDTSVSWDAAGWHLPGGMSDRGRAAPCTLQPLIYAPGGVGKGLPGAPWVGDGSAGSGMEKGGKRWMQTVPVAGSCVGGAGAVAGAQLLCCPRCHLSSRRCSFCVPRCRKALQLCTTSS